MIKIVSGWSNPGGSTYSLMELCDLFNENNLKCKFYGPHKWHLDKCSGADTLNNFVVSKDDVIIYHFTQVPKRLFCKKAVLSCHETVVFPLKKVNIQGVDEVRYVSQRQKDWQGVDGVVIPNLVRGITKSKNQDPKVAGVIGTIYRGKGVHESIERALSDGYEKVLIYGNITDESYYTTTVAPLLSDKVIHMGMETDRQKIYDSISCVYQSNSPDFIETFGRVRAECMLAGIDYKGNDYATTDFELWDESKVLDAWRELLEL